MTLRLILGIDPGRTGAIATLADGEPAGFIDMPVDALGRIDASRLAACLRGVLQHHAGAHLVVVLELVCGFSGQGGPSQFAFGRSDGIVRGVLGALGLSAIEVDPKVWKDHFGLVKKTAGGKRLKVDKDDGRVLAMNRFPRAALSLMQKKNGGRADALLIASWAEETEAYHLRTDALPDAAAG